MSRSMSINFLQTLNGRLMDRENLFAKNGTKLLTAAS
jgi:hypothetical protein